MDVIWKPLAAAPHLYEVSSNGEFRAKAKIDAMGKKRKQRALILSVTQDGYKKVNLFIDGRCFHPLAHRMVYETFYGPIPKGMEINHKNGVRDDNRPENLEAMSHAENVRYSKNVLGVDFTTYGNARMTKEQRDQIFQLYEQGFTQKKIAEIVGFGKSQISNVIQKKCWNV